MKTRAEVIEELVEKDLETIDDYLLADILVGGFEGYENLDNETLADMYDNAYNKKVDIKD